MQPSMALPVQRCSLLPHLTVLPFSDDLNAVSFVCPSVFFFMDLTLGSGEMIGCRWTMALKPRFILWRPLLTLTGQSHYTVDPASGFITSHTDTWDSLEDNNYFSVRF